VRLSLDQLTALTDMDAGPVTLLPIGRARELVELPPCDAPCAAPTSHRTTVRCRACSGLTSLRRRTSRPRWFRRAATWTAIQGGVAVGRLFELIRDVVNELAPKFPGDLTMRICRSCGSKIPCGTTGATARNLSRLTGYRSVAWWT
jgi:hypothetical protein